jgi:hypothetical protein
MGDKTTGALIGAGTSLLGMIGANTRRKQQMADQQKLMEVQQKNQMALNKQGQQLAQENWDYTNAENQVKHYENAGLNVGLMYGGSGAGGTLSSGSGGGASGGNAPQGESVSNIMGIGLQAQQIQSAIELNKAMANKANAEAEKTSGVDTESTIANTGLTKMNTENAKLESQLRSQGLEATLDTLIANRDKAVAESSSAITNANVSASTKETQINKINSEAANEAFKLTLMQADKNLTNEKARAITQELAQEWERLSIELDKVGIGKMNNAIQEFTAKMNARLGTQNLEMRRIEAGLNTAGKILNKGVNINDSGTRSTTIHNY